MQYSEKVVPPVVVVILILGVLGLDYLYLKSSDSFSKLMIMQGTVTLLGLVFFALKKSERTKFFALFMFAAFAHGLAIEVASHFVHW